MNDRSKTIYRLCSDLEARASYVSAKLSILVPSQIRALRLKSDMPRQSDLAREAKMQQSRISMFETPGAANLTLETLSRLAAVFKCGLLVKFVPFSEMLRWENNYSQDTFEVVKIDKDQEFINPSRDSGLTTHVDLAPENIVFTPTEPDEVEPQETTVVGQAEFVWTIEEPTVIFPHILAQESTGPRKANHA